MAATGLQSNFWSREGPEKQSEAFGLRTSDPTYRPEVLETIEAAIASLDPGLRALSLDMHDHPEIRWEEHRTHDIQSAYMEKQPGWNVTKHYLLPTAWKATFTHGAGGRTLGVNSEMDALPGIGHACGHNLIAISGIAVACAVKAALEKHDIPGTIVLLGTPAEEGGGGKVELLKLGGYEGIDACLMCHPAPGPRYSASLTGALARQTVNVEFTGHTAHAALSPWEGKNAVDAAVLSYNAISVLRQQLKPTHRVHGIFIGKDWTPNIIPDYAKMIWYVRAPTRAEMEAAVNRIIPCFKGGALSSGCEVEVEVAGATFDIRQNAGLAAEFENVFGSKYGPVDYAYGIAGASTDFGNVTYALPALHPSFGIPTVPNGGNHTAAFTQSAATVEAHKACLNISKALAATGLRVLDDAEFFAKVKATFEEDCRARVAEAQSS